MVCEEQSRDKSRSRVTNFTTSQHSTAHRDDRAADLVIVERKVSATILDRQKGIEAALHFAENQIDMIGN